MNTTDCWRPIWAWTWNGCRGSGRASAMSLRTAYILQSRSMTSPTPSAGMPIDVVQKTQIPGMMKNISTSSTRFQNLLPLQLPDRAAGAEHVKPGRPCDQRGSDRRRPQHVPAGGELLIPVLEVRRPQAAQPRSASLDTASRHGSPLEKVAWLTDTVVPPTAWGLSVPSRRRRRALQAFHPAVGSQTGTPSARGRGIQLGSASHNDCGSVLPGTVSRSRAQAARRCDRRGRVHGDS
jgi:hypothetical protein